MIAQIGMAGIEPSSGSGAPTLTATAAHGIRAEENHEPWAGSDCVGVNTRALPAPPVATHRLCCSRRLIAGYTTVAPAGSLVRDDNARQFERARPQVDRRVRR